ncbi:MAG: hypothetical protein GX631_02530, partial [Dehalococcoidales bacterium]|nr:hypothetical protein [Dehalococcoidales bacterium]
GKMIWESRGNKETGQKSDFTRGLLLISFAFATSIDALAVGLSFACICVDIVTAAVIIGSVAFIATIIGFEFGKRLGKLAGRWAEMFGGIVLIGIGLRILLSHLFS